MLIVQIGYLLLIGLFQTPALFHKLHGLFGLGDMTKSAADSLAYVNNSILMSLWILRGVIPIFPGLNKAEHYLRETLHEKALIPDEANCVVDGLQMHEDKFHPSATDFRLKI